MEKEINISAIQMCSEIGNKQANFHKLKELMVRDVKNNTDIIILPEVWNIGWKCEMFPDNAEEISSGETIAFLSSIAKEYNTFVIGGSFIEKRNNEFYNTCPVFNRNGELIGAYSKNHLFSHENSLEYKILKKGGSPVIVNLDGLKVGLSICYDIRFPEIYRAYRKAGADLLVNVAAWGRHKPVPWEIMTRSRAIENQTYMIALTQCGHIEGDEWNIGHSRIIDYKGEILNEIKDQKEGAMNYSINLNEMYEFRKNCNILSDIRQTYEVKIL